MAQVYGSAQDGSNANIGANTQINPAFFYKKALEEIVKERYFGNLASVRAMPKNMGKTIKQHHYMPLLHDENVNDQGLDGNSAATINEYTLEVYAPDASGDAYGAASYNYQRPITFVGNGSGAAAAILAAKSLFVAWVVKKTTSGGLGMTLAGANDDAKFATAMASAAGTVYALGYRVSDILNFVTDPTSSTAAANAIAATGLATGAVAGSGNLYASSKDPAYIASRLPNLGESGGRVNRVGFKRKTIEGTIKKFGFFDEYTKETVDFDTDAQLMMHITRETLRGANEIVEDMLQMDLLNAAGVIRFPGSAITTASLSGESADANTASTSEVTYSDIMKLGVDLDNNRCPKDTQVITGSRNVDTRTVNGARYLYIGSELIHTIKAMKDLHSNPAFIDVRHYAASGNTVRGEIGAIDNFRIVVVPEMMAWEGAGGLVTNNYVGYRATGTNYDVAPMLCVGSNSFTTVGFQTSGKSVKFKIKHAKPESPESYAKDPYGETGFYSIKWYYGFMALRPEWIGVIKTVARY